MPIQVVCSSCQARFSVSEKFAGKKGPCPKCKSVIQVPEAAADEIKIHAPEHSEEGAKGTSGRHVLKPIERKETKVQPMWIAGILSTVFVVFLIALVMRFSDGGPPQLILYLGAIVLGPPLAWCGYALLRNDEELQPFAGTSLIIRCVVSGAIYAVLWAVFTYVYGRFYGDDPLEVVSVFMLGGPFLLVGACAAYFSFDFDLTTSFIHYGLYLLVTVLLRIIMGLPPA